MCLVYCVISCDGLGGSIACAWKDVSGFAYKSFRLQVDLPTSRSFHLHDQVVSPRGLSRFAYIKVVSPTHKSKCFVKMDEHNCLQLAEESNLTVFRVKFLDIITITFVGINIFWARLSVISRIIREQQRS